jgi:hypothetical protein
VLDSLNKASGGKAEPLWQDNWDDDDVEDDFTKQLRYVMSSVIGLSGPQRGQRDCISAIRPHIPPPTRAEVVLDLC